MRAEDCYLRLAALSEAPESPLRQRPRNEWTVAEQYAVDICELIAIFDAAIRLESPLRRSVRLARLQTGDLSRIEAALQAIGATAQFRALARCHHYLTRGLQSVDADERHRQIAQRLGASPPLLYRLAEPVDSDELLQLLHAHLERRAIPTLPVLPLPTAVAAVRAAPVCVDAKQGSRAIYLLRDNVTSQQLLDRWMQRRGGAEYFVQGQHDHVPGYFELVHLYQQRRGFHGPLAYAVAGELHKDVPVQPVPFPPLDQQTGTQWQALAQRFKWALGATSIGTNTALVWASDDAQIVAEFEQELATVAADCLVSGFRRLGKAPFPAHGVCFNETRPYGMAALIAAENERVAPWLIAQLSVDTGHWWRKASARLPAKAWLRIPYHNRDNLFIAYRGTDREAFLELWSHLSDDDNIAFAAASGKLDPEALLLRVAETARSTESDTLRHLAGSDGWIYQHVWGGGSGEHYAIFYSSDAGISHQAEQFARNSESDHWVNYW